MGFGAIIASGEKNKLLRDDLVNCLTEMRVEQFLDEPTRFAIRFQEDIREGGPFIMKSPELQCEQMVTIAVQVGNARRCLVRGPITDVKCSVKLGGPGSWYEAHGQDRRVEMDRECVPDAWSVRASEAAETILNKNKKFDRIDVEETRIVNGGTRKGGEPTAPTRNQRSTVLAFIYRIARDCNLHFWIEYECPRNGLDPSGQSLQVEEQANLKSSPPRPKDAPAGPIPADQIKLVPTVQVKLRVNVEKEQCQNVTAFDLTMDPERPNQFTGTAIDDTDAQPHSVSPTDPDPTIIKGGQRFAGCKEPRDLCITTAGNQDELQCKAEAALTAAGWFVDATASTTAHMLGGVQLAKGGPQHRGAEITFAAHAGNILNRRLERRAAQRRAEGEIVGIEESLRRPHAFPSHQGFQNTGLHLTGVGERLDADLDLQVDVHETGIADEHLATRLARAGGDRRWQPACEASPANGLPFGCLRWRTATGVRGRG